MALNENPTLEEIIDEIDRLNNLIVDRGGERIITPTTTNQILAKGNYKGDITVLGDANLKSENILSGKSIFGIAGNMRKRNYATGSVRIENAGKSLPGADGIAKIYNLGFTPSLVIIYPDTNWQNANWRLTFAGSFITQATDAGRYHLADIIMVNSNDSTNRPYSYLYNESSPVSKITSNEIILPASVVGYTSRYIAVE